MAIFDLFSKREADAKKSGTTDVYQYEDIPRPLRVQVDQIALEGLGLVGFRGDRYGVREEQNGWWVEIEKIFLREKGLVAIGRDTFAGNRVLSYMQECDTPDWLDLFELVALSLHLSKDESAAERQRWSASNKPEAAISELNYRLRQAGVGFQFEAPQLLRVDSQFVHSEVIKPALTLLSAKGFEGPQEEFLSAHQHYRAGEYRQAIAMAANALESTFKAVFAQKNWTYSKGARISDLVKVARANSMWPTYLDAGFDQLVATLQNGLPKIRDNDASHGQGAEPREIPGYIAGYALHLAASKIVFITEAAK